MKILFSMLSVFGLLAFGAPLARAQNRADLEKERAAIQREIEDVKRSLDQTKRNRKQTLGQLALLQKRLRLRQEAISNINQQINVIESGISNSYSEIFKLRKEIDTLRRQYAESVVYAYENRSNYDFLNFIFAASSFNDALKRMAYLKSYRAYREERAENIVRTQVTLQSKIDGLRQQRVEKDDVLAKQTKERQQLEVEKHEKDEVVNDLRSRENELKKEMAAKQRQDAKLSSAIGAAIRRAREEAVREAKRKAAADAAVAAASAAAGKSDNAAPPAANPASTPATTKPAATPAKAPTIFKTDADVALSADFEKNRGHLPWPVASGNIAMGYGLHEYPGGVTHNNMGVTIETPSGTTVKAVFDGKVQSVFNVSDVSAVMVRHGKYFTTYSNLTGVTVTKGQDVKTGEAIGKVADIGQLEFVISDEQDRSFDPERWLHR